MLIFNNYFIYYFKKVKKLYNNYGIKLLYFPPYLPNFNLIEIWFSILKA